MMKKKRTTKRRAKDELTSKQERFIQEYLIDLNATAAYQRAGYKATGDVAAAAASRLLSNVKVQDRIQRAQIQYAKRTEVTAENILRELGRIAFSDPRRLFNADGSLKAVIELTDDDAACLASLEVLEEFAGRGEDRELVGHTKKLKLWNKNNALELAGKHIGLFLNRHEHQHSGKVGVTHDHYLGKSIASDPVVRDLACQILERIGEGVALGDASGPGESGKQQTLEAGQTSSAAE